MLEVFSTSYKVFLTVFHCVWHVIISICSLTETLSFSEIKYNDFTSFSVLQIMYENYYYEQLAKASSCVKHSVDAQLPFQLFLLVIKFYKSALYIIKYFKHRQSSISEILLLEFIKSTSLTTILIFPDLEIKQFWSVKYMCQNVCQVCTLHFLLWTFLKVWAIFIFVCF